MPMRMSQVPVEHVFLDARAPEYTGTYEFTLDCGAVYFGAVYNHCGDLMSIDQYFYTENFSRDDMDDAVDTSDLLLISGEDFPAKTYLLTKMDDGNEWMRFHAIVPETINTNYFRKKYSA